MQSFLIELEYDYAQLNEFINNCKQKRFFNLFFTFSFGVGI
jgi:hypothetical protein